MKMDETQGETHTATKAVSGWGQEKAYHVTAAIAVALYLLAALVAIWS